MSVDDMSVDDMSVDDMSVDEMSVHEMSVDEMAIDEISVHEMSLDKMSVDHMSVYKTMPVQAFQFLDIKNIVMLAIVAGTNQTGRLGQAGGPTRQSKAINVPIFCSSHQQKYFFIVRQATGAINQSF
jgi:hypothetical protein